MFCLCHATNLKIIYHTNISTTYCVKSELINHSVSPIFMLNRSPTTAWTISQIGSSSSVTTTIPTISYKWLIHQRRLPTKHSSRLCLRQIVRISIFALATLNLYANFYLHFHTLNRRLCSCRLQFPWQWDSIDSAARSCRSLVQDTHILRLLRRNAIRFDAAGIKMWRYCSHLNFHNAIYMFFKIFFHIYYYFNFIVTNRMPTKLS